MSDLRPLALFHSVAMVGVAIGPALGGLAVEHLPWQVLLVANAPIAALAWWGVRRGIAADDLDDAARKIVAAVKGA